MRYEKMKQLLSLDDMAKLSAFNSGNMDKPAIITKITNMLSDESPQLIGVSDDTRIRLFRLAAEYWEACSPIFLFAFAGRDSIDRLIEYAEHKMYKVSAVQGLRIATEKEIELGVKELVTEKVNMIGEAEFKYMQLLLWTFTGRYRYYISAGLEVTFENNAAVETDYQLIIRAGKLLRELVDWCKTPANYERTVATLKIARKHIKEYKYPTYAEDEIVENVPVKQIIYICDKNLKGPGETENQKKARGILYRYNTELSRKTTGKGNRLRADVKLEPEQISVLRRAYEDIENGYVSNNTDKLSSTVLRLCEKIEEGVRQKLVKPNDFSLKIIESVKSYGKCSDKQLAVLKKTEEAMDRAIKAKAFTAKKDTTEVKSEVAKMYDALGDGTLFNSSFNDSPMDDERTELESLDDMEDEFFGSSSDSSEYGLGII